MNFNLRIDSGALINLSGVTPEVTGVQVTDSELVVSLGQEFDAHINRSAITHAEPFPDPRPSVYFPMGLSSAVNQIGPDTVCVVTSYDGLVKVDLGQQVEGQGRFIEPTRPAGAQVSAGSEPIVTPPSAWRSLLRFVIVIVALVVLYELISHGLGLLALLLIVLLIVGLIARSVISSRQAAGRKKSTAPTERAPISFRHIIVSVDDPQGFINALGQRGGAVAARPAR